MMTQFLFGKHFRVSKKNWSRVKTIFDKCEGWIINSQLAFLPEDEFVSLQQNKDCKYVTDLISFVEDKHNQLTPILLGSNLPNTSSLDIAFDGTTINQPQPKNKNIKTSLLYFNSPEIKGGRTPFGIDAAGFTQMVYKINGHPLLRTAENQSTQGTALSFVEESEAGDLAFFDNTNGVIDHVGIIMDNNYIIHVKGMIRIDHTGIFNNDLRNYTHQLRVIKKFI